MDGIFALNSLGAAPTGTSFAPLGFGTPGLALDRLGGQQLLQQPGMQTMQSALLLQSQMMLQLMTDLVQLMLNSQAGGQALGGLAGNSGGLAQSGGSSAGGLGQSGGSGGSNFSSGGGQLADPSQFQGGTEMGRKLAAAALKESTDGDSQGGWCARDVGEALRAVGLGVARGDAWTKAAVLANDKRFREIQVSDSDLDRLPPGAIIVWDKGPGLPYGHISIALGDGREASDLLKKQMHLKTKFRVFMPL